MDRRSAGRSKAVRKRFRRLYPGGFQKRGEGQGRLHLIVLQGGSMLEGLTPEQCQDVLRQVSLGVIGCLDGYQVRRVLMEATSTVDTEHVKLFPIWQVQSTHESFHRDNPGNSWNRDRVLFAIDCADGPSFVVKGGLEPILRLRSSDQDLLAAALNGSTDMELSKELGLKLPTLKKRWAALFNRVAIAKPDLLPEHDDHPDRQARGRQKKHRLLAYVREHPQELRPFLHPQMSSRRQSTQSSTAFAPMGK